MTVEEIAALVATAKDAADLAEMAGVHIRTAYKWMTRHKQPLVVAPPPADFNRIDALGSAIDRAILALTDDTLASVERLSKLLRATRQLSALSPKMDMTQFADTRRLLAAKLASMTRPGLEQFDRLEAAMDDAEAPKEQESSPPIGPRAPLPTIKPADAPFGGNVRAAGDFWKAPDNRPGWIGQGDMRGVNEPPTPTSQQTTKLPG